MNQVQRSTLKKLRSCLFHSGYISLRFLRSKCSPWLRLAIAAIRCFSVSGRQRTYAQTRCVSALVRIDFVGLYQLLNDLLW